MHDDIGAELQRLLQRWRQEGVVDDDKRADGMRGLRHVAYIGDSQQWIGRCLDPDQRRLGGKALGERRGVGEVDEANGEALLLRPGVEQAPGAAVAIVSGEHQRTSGNELERQCNG